MVLNVPWRIVPRIHMLILSNSDVERLISIGEAIEALRISNREVAEFKYNTRYRLNRSRTNYYLPWQNLGSADAGAADHVVDESDSSIYYNFKSMEGGSPHFGVWALRSSSDLVRLRSGAYGPTHTYMRYGDLPGGKGYSDLIFLYNIHDAQFEAIIQAAALQGIRVAATSALGTDYLCRPDVRRAGLFGSGWQATANLRALLCVRPSIDHVKVFSPNPDNRKRFAARMCKELAIDVQPASSPEEAVRGMEVIYEASSARTPVFDGDLIEEGQHIMSVGAGDEHFERRLIDPKAVARCSIVGVHSLEVKFGLEEIVDCLDEGTLDKNKVVDLPDLVTGKVVPAISDHSISFFKNNVGLGSQFASVGGLVLQKARAQQVGVEVPQKYVSQVMVR